MCSHCAETRASLVGMSREYTLTTDPLRGTRAASQVLRQSPFLSSTLSDIISSVELSCHGSSTRRGRLRSLARMRAKEPLNWRSLPMGPRFSVVSQIANRKQSLPNLFWRERP
jgi:hypothetical protein